MTSKTANEVVLALYPNRRGIGYAVFNSPKELVAFGQGYIRPMSNTKCLKRIKEYLEYYKPNIILIRAERDTYLKSTRTRKLINRICREAGIQGMDVYQYSRRQIKETFIAFNAFSKYQISQKIVTWFPDLKGYAFPDRKRWMSEHSNTGIFDAMALAVTHYYLQE